MNTHADKLAAALRECKARLDLLIGKDRHKLLDVVAVDRAREALAAHDARTFANDCHDMADSCAAILRNDDAQRQAGQYERLREADRQAVSRLRAYAHGVGDEAECSPELFKVQP